MFEDIGLTVQSGPTGTSFAFRDPVSLLLLQVNDGNGGVMWELVGEIATESVGDTPLQNPARIEPSAADTLALFEVVRQQAERRFNTKIDTGMWNVPLAEATPEMLELAGRARSSLRELSERPPMTPVVSRVQYGVAPPGYRSERAAAALAPGMYLVVAHAQQGQAIARFTVT